MMTRATRLFLVGFGFFAAMGSSAYAAILFFDIDAAPGAWAAATSSFSPYTAYDFDADPDYGLTTFDEPLTSAGGGPVSPGNLAPDVVMSEVNFGGPTDELFALGPSFGLGNPSNAVGASSHLDAFAIDFLTATPVFQFNALTVLGSGTVDITVTGTLSGPTLFSGVAVGTGKNIGLLGTPGDLISSVMIYDPTSADFAGAEGVQGFGGLAGTAAVPEPASLTLVGLGALGMVFGAIRRRRDQSA